MVDWLDEDARPEPGWPGDLLIVSPGDKFKALIQRDTKTNSFDEQDIMPPGGNAAEPWLGSADVDGDGQPVLLLAEKNFVRASC